MIEMQNDNQARLPVGSIRENGSYPIDLTGLRSHIILNCTYSR